MDLSPPPGASWGLGSAPGHLPNRVPWPPTLGTSRMRGTPGIKIKVELLRSFQALRCQRHKLRSCGVKPRGLWQELRVQEPLNTGPM